MGKVQIKLNLKGINELMKSAEMQAALDQAATALAGHCGEGYEVEKAHPIRYIGIASVRPVTGEARRDNRKNNTLLKAMGRTKI